MRRSMRYRSPHGMHTPLQRETNLWNIPFVFCLTEAQQCLSPACKETPARACRRQLLYPSCSISTFTWAEVVGCILRQAVPLLCVTGVLGQIFLECEGSRFKTSRGLESKIAAIYNYAEEGWGSMRPWVRGPRGWVKMWMRELGLAPDLHPTGERGAAPVSALVTLVEAISTQVHLLLYLSFLSCCPAFWYFVLRESTWCTDCMTYAIPCTSCVLHKENHPQQGVNPSDRSSCIRDSCPA